jgi:Arc/MetJ-type ribon-helix-helix transcriptional regulator
MGWPNITAEEEKETKLALLRAALIEAERSGASASFDFEAFLARKRDDDASYP